MFLEEKRLLAIDISKRLLGTPYIWGGDDPINGLDCSGFVIEVLKSVGILPRKGDWTADGLMHKFKNYETIEPLPGCLVWWGSRKDSNHAVHIEFCLSDELSIGASGGGSRTKTESDAIIQNAYIKIRNFYERPNIIMYADPFKNIEGV